jgi:hypothetical protein
MLFVDMGDNDAFPLGPSPAFGLSMKREGCSEELVASEILPAPLRNR